MKEFIINKKKKKKGRNCGEMYHHLIFIITIISFNIREWKFYHGGTERVF